MATLVRERPRDRRAPRRWSSCVLLPLLVVLASASCGSGKPTGSATTGTSTSAATGSTPLSAPKTTPVQDAKYYEDVGTADPALATYMQQEGDVGLRAVLTDGTAFCAFLQRGGGIDDAMVDVALGAKSVETQTDLPSNVTTFNTMESVALLTLCPSEQKLVPAAVRTKINSLGQALAG